MPFDGPPSWLDFATRPAQGLGLSAAELLVFDGTGAFDRIDPATGHFTDAFGQSVLITELNGLRVEAHKQVWLVMAAGLLLGSRPFMERAIRAAEAILAFRSDAVVLDVLYTGLVGSFPAHDFGAVRKLKRFHNKTIVVDRIAWMLDQFLRSAFADDPAFADLRARVDALVAQIADVAAWVISDDTAQGSTTPNIEKFFEATTAATGAANQRVSVCSFLETAGVLLGDENLRSIAQVRLQQVFDQYIVNDVIVEKLAKDGVGFDGSYFTFSLELLCYIWLSLSPGAWRDIVKSKIELLTRRWLLTVDVGTGLISTIRPTVWTRVKETPPRVPGAFAKGWNWDNIPYRLMLLNYILGDAVVPPDLAAKVASNGQSFGHIGAPGDDDDPDEPTARLYLILDSAAKLALLGPTAVEVLSATHPWHGLRPIARQGGGLNPRYPGGVLPATVWIAPVTVLTHPAYAAWAATLGPLPRLDGADPLFPPAISL